MLVAHERAQKWNGARFGTVTILEAAQEASKERKQTERSVTTYTHAEAIELACGTAPRNWRVPFSAETLIESNGYQRG